MFAKLKTQIMSHLTCKKQTSMILVCHGGSLMHQWPIVAVTFLKSARMFEHPKNAPDTSANHPWRTNAAWRIRAITLNVEKIWKIGTKKRGLFPLGLQTSLFLWTSNILETPFQFTSAHLFVFSTSEVYPSQATQGWANDDPPGQSRAWWPTAVKSDLNFGHLLGIGKEFPWIFRNLRTQIPACQSQKPTR